MGTRSSRPIDIAPASESDAEAIATVLLAAFRDFEALYTPDAFRVTTPDATQIADRVGEGPVWVAREDNTVVGTVSALERGDEVYVRSMAVLPGARGRGIGRRLLAAVEAFAASRDARRLSLTTTPFLTAAIGLYERAGFRRAPGQLDLHSTPLIAMVKELSGKGEPP